MEGHGEQTHYVKRVLLPSGKTIEVVYFRDSAPADSEALQPTENPPAEPHQDLHVCMECSSELVYPVEWEESGTENWSVLLHCPNCELYREGIFSQHTVDDHVRDEYLPQEIRQKVAAAGLSVQKMEAGFGFWGELSFELNNLFWDSRFLRNLTALITLPVSLVMGYMDASAHLQQGNSILLVARRPEETEQKP